jgi:hypothetical protein
LHDANKKRMVTIDRRPNQNARADMARSDKGIIPRRQNCPRHRYLGYTLRFSLQRTPTRSVGWTVHLFIYLFHSFSTTKVAAGTAHFVTVSRQKFEKLCGYRAVAERNGAIQLIVAQRQKKSEPSTLPMTREWSRPTDCNPIIIIIIIIISSTSTSIVATTT